MRFPARTPQRVLLSADQPVLSKFLTEKAVDAEIVFTDGNPTFTAAEAAAALGLDNSERVVKSLVFVTARGEALLVLAPGTSRVHRPALEAFVGCQVRMATFEEATELTGHPPGVIPPFSPLQCARMTTLLDTSVLELPSPVFTGAGEPCAHLSLAPLELLRASAAALGSFIELSIAADGTPLGPEAGRSAPMSLPSPSPPPTDTPLARQHPPAPPPPPPATATATAIATDTDIATDTAPPPLSPEGASPSVTARGVDQRPGGTTKPLREDVAAVVREGPLCEQVTLHRVRVTRVRRQARLLLFASCVLLERPRPEPPVLQDSGDEWQLLLGTTLVQNEGERAASELMRSLRPGALLRVTGRPQRNPRLPSLDLVVSAFETIDESGETSTPRVGPADAAGAALPADRPPPLPSPPPSDAPSSPLAAPSGPRPSPADSQEDGELLGLPEVNYIDDDATLSSLASWLRALPADSTIGIDVEWRPASLEGAAQSAVSLLQLASADATFVIDILVLRRNRRAADTLTSVITALMADERLIKLGFALAEDLQRLETALPG